MSFFCSGIGWIALPLGFGHTRKMMRNYPQMITTKCRKNSKNRHKRNGKGAKACLGPTPFRLSLVAVPLYSAVRLASTALTGGGV